jgi:3'-phosphoadenosine 5'-phosphosulfate sulfotransferase (PAPS reductase)/FAD synthetase
MELDLFPEHKDYSGQKVLLGLSGGINSMAVLCWLAEGPKEFYPAELHLYYTHLVEHSPDTFQFVADGVRWARKAFPCVIFRMSRGSAIELFRQQKMIPHPTKPLCSIRLKIEPVERYMVENGITVNLVGYVKKEAVRRASRMAMRTKSELNNVISKGISVSFPISKYSDNWCFTIVDKHIGWHPVIYDIRERGKKVFTHNNCLPCMHMEEPDLKATAKHYPKYMKKALDLSGELKRHWGRDADSFYTTFGREDYEKEYKPQPCEVCAFD